jgi:23S rRNA (guanosine2251-2'-O)-methyltransferase
MSRDRHLFVHGFRAIEEFISEASPGSVLMLARAGARHRKLAELAAASGVPVRHVPEGELNRHADASRHRGALLRMRDRRRRTGDRQLDEIIARTDHPALALAVDGVTDTANLGAILRSAEGFGVDLVILQADRAAAVTPAAMRAAAGATAYLTIVTVTNLARALTRFQQHGFWVVGADLDGQPLNGYRFAERVVVVVGSEGSGIRPGVRVRCDALVTVETVGSVGSLNVSVATGIVLYRAACSRDAARSQRALTDTGV